MERHELNYDPSKPVPKFNGEQSQQIVINVGLSVWLLHFRKLFKLIILYYQCILMNGNDDISSVQVYDQTQQMVALGIKGRKSWRILIKWVVISRSIIITMYCYGHTMVKMQREIGGGIQICTVMGGKSNRGDPQAHKS